MTLQVGSGGPEAVIPNASPSPSPWGGHSQGPGPMAHFVKWCKARFLNGYKQFSVLQQDCHDGRSDTEELLREAPPPSPFPVPGAEAETDAEAEPSAAPSHTSSSRERTPSQERAARRERLPSPERERDKDKDKDKEKDREKEQQPNRQLNFEEFECDVSVEGGVDEAGQERQEFSFTLYDFDGHGKITKDDITGLVSTIYDTLGASIKVPHYGSKTIKVKLTVSPDKRCGPRGAGTQPPTYANAPPHSTPRVRFKRDLNVTIQERRPAASGRSRRTSSASARRRPTYVNAAPQPAAPAATPAPRSRERERERELSEDRGYVLHSCSSSCRSGAGSEGGDGSADEDDVEEDEDELARRTSRLSAATGLSPASVAAAAATAATVASAAASSMAAMTNGQSSSPHTKKRSSSMQRQELLQIIQANMEKNNLCFQTAKKSCTEKTGLEERRHSHSGADRRQRHKAGHQAGSLSASASPQRIYDYATTPYYVNVADHATATADADTYRYVVCTPKHQPTYLNVPCRERGHNRSKSHDLSTTNTHNHAHNHNHTHSHNPAAPLFRYTLLQEDSTSSVQALNVRPAAPAPAPVQSPAPAVHRRARLPLTAAGHTSSPHHLKHRNREQDQARAMAQVVQWLEQEFSASLNTRTTAGVQEVLINAKAHRSKGKSAAFSPAPEVPPVPSAAQAPNASAGSPPRPAQDDEPSPSASAAGVKQHEHHHVHEHIHHHYHHYQETPPVLV